MYETCRTLVYQLSRLPRSSCQSSWRLPWGLGKKQPSSTLTNNRLDRIQDNEKKKELKYRAVDLVDSRLWESSSVASIGIYKL
jgi:hypothetical protein